MVSIASIAIDCYDAQNLAEFWSAVLHADVLHDADEYVVLDYSPRLSFQNVPEPTPGKNRVHIDIESEDLASDTERIIALGATMIEQVRMNGGRWNVLADPEGNHFCLAGPFDHEHP
ncbi:VOC family protein [Austwickia chelonae]|uniref:VOC family protein n=1 Tax=Austwickia chelonae TaxID=100225 RepID=UPI000E23ABBB|nr:VOC family protein [Austwickia chelonae]